MAKAPKTYREAMRMGFEETKKGDTAHRQVEHCTVFLDDAAGRILAVPRTTFLKGQNDCLTVSRVVHGKPRLVEGSK
jgi:hypothetical protein